MRILNVVCLLFVLSLFFACEENTSGNSSSDNTSNEVSTDSSVTNNGVASTPPDEYADVASIPDQKDCELSAKHYDKNVFLAKDVAQLVCIVADESTYDQNLGDSHRIFEVINTTDCSSMLKETLPINRSADFPFYLVPETYESTNQVIAIQGFSSFYLYDVKNKKLNGPTEPQFLGETEAVDAQSGMVRGLTIWGKYLMGHAIDYGNFAFDISDPNMPKPVIPVAKYNIPNTGEYNYLFILEVGNDRYQAVLPTQDIDAGGTLFDPAKLFLQPLKINTTVAKNVRNNRFIIFNDNTNPGQELKVAIDMFRKRQVQLPADIATKKTSEVLNWLNAQG